MAQERYGSGRPDKGPDNGRGDWETTEQRRQQDQQGSSAGWHGEGYGGGRHDEDRNEFGGQGRFREHGGHGSHFGGAPQGQEVRGPQQGPGGWQGPTGWEDQRGHSGGPIARDWPGPQPGPYHPQQGTWQGGAPGPYHGQHSYSWQGHGAPRQMMGGRRGEGVHESGPMPGGWHGGPHGWHGQAGPSPHYGYGGWPQGQAPASPDDEDYYHWLQQQISRFHEDYAAWRQERRQKFAEDFDRWRHERATGSKDESGKAPGETDPPAAGRKPDK